MKKNIDLEYDIDLIINSLSRGGAERVCVTLANELCDNGYKIRIITLRNVKNNYLDDVDDRIYVECLNAKKDILGLLKLKKYLKNHRFNTILAFDERITAICNYEKVKNHFEYKIITRVINNIDFQEKNNKRIIYKLLFKFSKKYFKYSDKFIFQCNEMKKRMIQYFDIESNKKSIVIYNPLSEKFSDVSVNKNKSNYFIMVGRLDNQKGYQYIIEALKICKKNNDIIKIKILGDGPLREEIQNKLTSNGIHSVELLGNVSNVKDYYCEAKALILTSNYEGFPNVLLEANACGCPVIAFDCPTGPSEIIDNINGILVDYLDYEKLAKVLVDFEKIKWDYDKISEITKQRYNKNLIIKKYIDEVNNI